VYQSQVQLLDLFEEVTLARNDGSRFLTRRAHLDLSAGSAEGHDPVAGRGPSGDITAEGFHILSKGETIIFMGHCDLLLKGAKPNTATAAPPALPPEVEEAAAQIEAAALAAPPSATVEQRQIAAEPFVARNSVARHDGAAKRAAAEARERPAISAQDRAR
jgi:hypothetical protein